MKKTEVAQILIVICVLSFSAVFTKLSIANFLYFALLFAVIFAVNLGAKKAWAYKVGAGVDTSIWHFQRFGYYERSYLRTPIPIGVILPFLISILSLGRVSWMAVTQSEISATSARAAKKHSIYRFTEMTGWDEAWIVAMGFAGCLVLAVVAYFLSVPELSRLAILFASFNMLPLGKLDGTKLFFGNPVLWTIFAVLCLVGLGYVFFLV